MLPVRPLIILTCSRGFCLSLARRVSRDVCQFGKSRRNCKDGDRSATGTSRCVCTQHFAQNHCCSCMVAQPGTDPGFLACLNYVEARRRRDDPQRLSENARPLQRPSGRHDRRRRAATGCGPGAGGRGVAVRDSRDLRRADSAGQQAQAIAGAGPEAGLAQPPTAREVFTSGSWRTASGRRSRPTTPSSRRRSPDLTAARLQHRRP